ncbi:MAG: hypothetical protein K2H80_01985 [Ureaplasma sp.]|nr:hypothetical protein [Ureaplasma sp.]
MDCIQAKHYRNLLNISIDKLDELELNNSNVIASNCISLIAGLIFTLLKKNNKLSFGVFYSIDELNKSNLKFKFLLIKKDNIIDSNEIKYYFEYAGTEENILCI